jgi:hypothetical protein
VASCAPGRLLYQEQRLSEGALAELVEVNADLTAVDKALAAELAKEAEARTAQVRAEGAQINQDQRDALAAFGEWFAAGYPLWENYADAVRELDALWPSNPAAFGDRAPHVLADHKFPVRFASLLELAAGSMHRDWSLNGDRNPLNEFVPDSLPRDPQLEVGGSLDRC